MKLRDYQADWLERAQAALGRVLMVGPTGCGKTVVAAHLIRSYVERGERVLFLAHRQELVHQCVERLQANEIERVGVIMAGSTPDPEAAVQVASVQTLAARDVPTGFGLIVIDEAHHAITASYQAAIAANPQARIYGLTATPERLDGKPLGDLFDVIVESLGVEELIELGALAKPRVWSCKPEDLSGVKSSRGDYDRTELAGRVKHLVGNVVDHWERLAKGLPTVVYAVNVTHAYTLQERFAERGHATELLTGKTPLAQRKELLKRFEAGAFKILVNVEVLTEGWDCPVAECCVLARPTRSATLLRQMVGRVMRPKTARPLVLDHAGNYVHHELPTVNPAWSLLDGSRPVLRHGEARYKLCPECGSVVGFGCRMCASCEHEFWPKGGLPQEVQDWLTEVTQNTRKTQGIQALRDGVSAKQVGKRFRAGWDTVVAWAQEAGVEIPAAPGAPEATKREALSLVQRGASATKAAQAVGVSNWTVNKWVKDAGLSKPKPESKPFKPQQHGPWKGHHVVALVRSGMTRKAVAELLDIDHKRIARWCSEAGLKEESLCYPDAVRQRVIVDARQGVPLKQLARQTCIPVLTIRKWLKR